MVRINFLKNHVVGKSGCRLGGGFPVGSVGNAAFGSSTWNKGDVGRKHGVWAGGLAWRCASLDVENLQGRALPWLGSGLRIEGGSVRPERAATAAPVGGPNVPMRTWKTHSFYCSESSLAGARGSSLTLSPEQRSPDVFDSFFSSGCRRSSGE